MAIQLVGVALATVIAAAAPAPGSTPPPGPAGHTGPDTMTRTVRVEPEQVHPADQLRVTIGLCGGTEAQAESPVFDTPVELLPVGDELAGTATVNGNAEAGTYPVEVDCKEGGAAEGSVTVSGAVPHEHAVPRAGADTGDGTMAARSGAWVFLPVGLVAGGTGLLFLYRRRCRGLP